MQFRDGTVREKALFAVLVGVYILGLIIALQDKVERVGQPDVGWLIERGYVSPTRADASMAGLLGGGRPLRINGVDIERDHHPFATQTVAALRTNLGDSNTLTFQPPRGNIREVTIRVRAWEWKDVLYEEGATAAMGLIFFVVGVTSFLLRPYQTGSWALLSLCTVTGGLLTTLFVPMVRMDLLVPLYFLTLAGVICYMPFHAGLAFPVVHPLLLNHPRVLPIIYGLGFGQACFYLAAFFTDWPGPLEYARPAGSATLLAAILFFIGRCIQLAVFARDPLVAQRARILLAGTLFGLAPFALVQFMQETFDALAFDNRFVFLPLSFFLLALGRITVRYELLNARIAARRAVMYAWAVGILTVLAILLSMVRSYAVALLLFPLLYLWPRFEARLNARLYPKRARFPELLRTIGDEMAASTTVDAVLDILAQAPADLCDAQSSVAFIFSGVSGPGEHIRASEGSAHHDRSTLAEEPLVRLMTTTRKEIFRDHIAVEPQYSNIKDDCYAGFDRLSANILLPILHDNRVVGGLAIGPRTTGDVYEAAEIDAFSTIAQQAVQAIIRVEATERLRARELEFADLKRFFPPPIIDQVMARGGAAELRTQRKLVTVFFADLRGFTSFSDSVEPEEVMATLAEYHTAMGQRIGQFAGTLERFAGDGFMVFFNDPVDQLDHAERAVRMALAMQADVQRLRDGWERKGYQMHVGMGIHTGYATCGFIGYEGRRDYGVIGNVTNLAARLSDAAGPGDILITARVLSELANGSYRTEPAGNLVLKGFHQPQPAYRLLQEYCR